MERHQIFIVIALALALAVPAYAAAEWAGRGFYEPDTALDIVDGYNFENPDTDPDTALRQVYFSAYVVNDDTQHNPNVALLGSNHIASPYTNFNAFLGVWKDCNDDGYIGMVDSVLLEYRAELLASNEICPAGQSAHNDGTWVSEFIWIGPDDAASCGIDPNEDNDTTPLNIADDCSRVWGDIGVPTDEGAITCPLVGWSRGTFQSTGGLQRYADCIATYRMYDTINTVADATDADETAGIQLDMHDVSRDRPDQSGSILNQKNPYGNPGGNSMVTVWDCGAPIPVRDPTAPEGGSGDLRSVNISDPTGGDLSGPQDIFIGTLTVFDEETHEYSEDISDDEGNLATFYTPTVPSVDPTGSPAGTVNATLEGLDDCDRSAGLGWESDVYGVWLESDFEPSTPVRKDHDITLEFRQGFRGCFDILEDGSTCALGENQPPSFGVFAARDAAPRDSLWYGTIPYTASRNGFINIDDFTPQKAQYFSFYAYVSPEVVGPQNLALAHGQTYAVYGADHCDGAAPKTGYWECVAANWWLDGTGTSIRNVWQVAVGQEFNLRDIDCYDETYMREQGDTTTQLLAESGCDR